jgi:hypothetical protein
MNRHTLVYVAIASLVVLSSPVAARVSAAVTPAGEGACCPGERRIQVDEEYCPQDKPTARSCGASTQADEIRTGCGAPSIGCETLVGTPGSDLQVRGPAGCGDNRTGGSDPARESQTACCPIERSGAGSDHICCGTHAELYSSARGFCLVITLGRERSSANLRIDPGALRRACPKGCDDAGCR